MRDSKFLCIGLLPFLLCSLLLLALTMAFKWREIEREVAESTRSSLGDAGHDWAKVETFNRGRNVLLTGVAPSEIAKADALSIAENAYGVRSASYAGEIATNTTTRTTSESTNKVSDESTSTLIAEDSKTNLAPAELDILSDGSKVTLTGRLATQREADTLIANATRVFGAGNVANNLTVAESTEPLTDILFLQSLKFEGDQSSNIVASLNDDQLTLTGAVPNPALSQSIEQSAASKFNGKISNQLVVSVPIIERDVCQDKVNEVLAKGKINFQTAKADISIDSYELLNRVYDVARGCPNASFEIAGHTDNTGNFDFNMTLSKQRAQSVLDYLVEKGLSSSRLNAAGYGPERPVADNSTDEGRAKNRRIELKLSN